MTTNHDLAIHIAFRYLQAHPAQRAVVEAILDKLDDGTFIPSTSPGAVTAINEAIAFMNNVQTVVIPALVAQLTAMRTSVTPV